MYVHVPFYFVDLSGKAKAAEGEQLWSADLYWCVEQTNPVAFRDSC